MGGEESQLTGSISSMYVVSQKNVYIYVLQLITFTSRNPSYAGQAVIVTSICANLASPVAGPLSESIPPFSESKASTRLWIAA